MEKGWYEGTINGKTGVFPSNHVIRINDEKNKTNQPIKHKSVDGHNSSTKRDVSKKSLSIKARVLYDYKAAANDELTLKKNDFVTIIDKHVGEDGWWKVEFSINMRNFLVLSKTLKLN